MKNIQLVQKMIKEAILKENDDLLPNLQRFRQRTMQKQNQRINGKDINDLAFDLLDFAAGDLKDTMNWFVKYKMFFDENKIEKPDAERIYNLAMQKQEQP